MLTTLGSILFWGVVSPIIAIIIFKNTYGTQCALFRYFILYIWGVLINCGIMLVVYMIGTCPLISTWEYNPKTIDTTIIYSLSECMTTNIEKNKNGPFQIGQTNNEKTYGFIIKDNNEYAFNEVKSVDYKIVRTDSIGPCVIKNATGYIIHFHRPFKWIMKDIVCDTGSKNPGGTIYIPTNAIMRPYKKE